MKITPLTILFRVRASDTSCSISGRKLYHYIGVDLDDTAPIITLNVRGLLIQYQPPSRKCLLYIDANASWNDAVDGFGVIVASGEVNASDSGNLCAFL